MSDPGDAKRRNKEAASSSGSSPQGLGVSGEVGGERRRKWARKGNDGFWGAMSKAAPWAGMEFKLTKERDEQYEGTYQSGYREDDALQLQGILKDATFFRIPSPFLSKTQNHNREFRHCNLQVVSDKCEHFLFLVQSLADVLQMKDKPAPVLEFLEIHGWATPKYCAGLYGRTLTAEEKHLLEAAEVRVLKAVQLILEAAKSGKLKTLAVLGWTGVGLNDATLEALSDEIAAGKFPSLIRIFLGLNRFGSKGATAFLHAMESGKLQGRGEFWLGCNNLGDEGCEAYEKSMSAGTLQALRVMDFRGNDIGDRGAQALARGFQSGKVKTLAKLDLSWNRIGDHGMVSLTTSLVAAKFTELRQLDFRSNPFGTEGIQSLAKALESGHLNSLQKLSIENGHRKEVDAKPLMAAVSVNTALTLELSFDVRE